MRKIYGPTRNPDNGEYKRRKNSDIRKIFNRPNIQNCLMSKRIGRAKQELINNVLTNKPVGMRPRDTIIII